MIYTACKKVIETGRYDKEEMLNKLNVFYLGDQLTEKQYKELKAMVKN